MSASIGRLIQRSAGNPVSRLSFIASRPTTSLNFTKLRVLTYAFRTKVTARTKTSAAKKTTTRKTAATKKKPAAKKVAVKSKTTKKTAARGTKKTAAKGAKKPVKKTVKAAPKKKVVKKAKKALVKKTASPKKKKRALTDEEKFAEKVKQAKKTILKPPQRTKASAYNMFCVTAMRRSVEDSGHVVKGFLPITKDIARVWRTLPPSEKAKYETLAKDRNDKLAVEFNKFLKNYTVDEIRKANNARRWLRINKVPRVNTAELKDPRKPKMVGSPFVQFVREKYNTFEGDSLVEKAKSAGKTWKSLSDIEKKPYLDITAAAKQRVKSEQHLQAAKI